MSITFNHKSVVTSLWHSPFLVIFCFLLLFGQPLYALDSIYRIYATTGDDAIDDNGTITNLAGPILNTTGALAFNVRFQNTNDGVNDDSAIYRYGIVSPFLNTNSIPIKPVRENSNVNIDGTSYLVDDVFLSSFVMGGNPFMAVRVPIKDAFGESFLALHNSQDFVSLIAKTGDTVESGNGEYSNLNNSSFQGASLNNQILFFNALDNTNNGSDDNNVLFRYTTDGSVDEVIREDDSSFGYFHSISANKSSGLTFLASEEPTSNATLYRVDNGSVAKLPLLTEGDLASTEGEARFYDRISQPKINLSGNIAFTSYLRDEDGFAVGDGSSGLFWVDGLVTKTLLLEDQSTPDNTATYQYFESPIFSEEPRIEFNNNDEVSFRIRINLNPEVGGGQKRAIYKASEDHIVEIVREDDAYDGGTLDYIDDPHINEQGLVAFRAVIWSGEIDPGEGAHITEDAILISNGEDIVTVVKTGQEIAGKTVTHLSDFSFNDVGEIGFQATFEDFTRSIVLWTPLFAWSDVNSEGEWDNADSWAFDQLPSEFTDLNINPDTDLNLAGPTLDTLINSLIIGGDLGSVHLSLGAGVLSVTNDLNIKENSHLTLNQELNVTVLNNEGTLNVIDNGIVQIQGDVSTLGVINLGVKSQVTISGTLTLAGILNAQVTLPDQLSKGDVVLQLQANQIIGEFDDINLPTLINSDLRLKLTKDDHSLRVVVESLSDNEGSGNENSEGGGGVIVGWMIFLLMLLLVISPRLKYLKLK